MTRRASLAFALATIVWGTPSVSLADTLDEQLGPRELALGDSTRGNAVGSQAITLNPSGIPGNAELVLEGSYGYRFTDGASVLTASACDSTGIVPGCYYYRYLGASPDLGGGISGDRRAHEGGMALALRVSPRLSLGGNVKYFDYNSMVPGESDDSGFTFDLGATLVLMPQFRIGVVGHHLFGGSIDQYPRALGTGVVIVPTNYLQLSFDAVWRLERPDGESTGRYGGGAELFLNTAGGQAGYAVRVGAVHDVQLDGTFISGGAGFKANKVGVDVGLRRQISGGDETIIQVSLRLFPRRRIPGTPYYQ